MKTDIKLIQIIVSLLKQNDIRHIVISPGTRHVPLVHCVEMDNFFTCYSVVDERSAGYFALGLSETLNRPVCVTCTSSTAACNYMPAMKEAYERGIQLVALTSDKARYRRFHGISQCIDQVDMYKPYCKYSVDLPIVTNNEDYWYCNRCVNEALLELDHNGTGPVQINFLEPVAIDKLATFSDGEIPETRKINRYVRPIDWDLWSGKLKSVKKILVFCGQYYQKDSRLGILLESFASKYNAVVTYDNFSNVRGENFILSPLFGQTMNMDEVTALKPDIIITYGSKVYSDLYSHYYNMGIEHWDINPEGIVFDSSHSLKNIFECSPETFFEALSQFEGENDLQYLSIWKNLVKTRSNGISEFSNYYVAKRVLDNLPENALVHASVLNSMKFTNYCELKQGVDAFGNICADGIDGALSTFLGQSCTTERICLLIVGDLSFLYDLNSANYIIGNNIRILLINNKAGGEFHYNIGIKKIPTIDKHIAASHHTELRHALSLINADYLSASNEKELDDAIKHFFQTSDKPVLLEVFTDANSDGECLRGFLARNHVRTKSEKMKIAVRRIIGNDITNKIKKIIYGAKFD